MISKAFVCLPNRDSQGYANLKNLILLCCVLGFSLSTSRLQALQFYYADDRPEALAICDGSAYQGDVDESTDCYRQIVADPDSVAKIFVRPTGYIAKQLLLCRPRVC